jgi:signal peptidase I
VNPPEAAAAEKPARVHAAAPSPVWRILRWVERLLACVGLCFLLFHTSFEATVMTSGSMAPTLQGTSYENGDRILVEKVTRWFRPPRRWEIYFFYDPDGVPVAKRIVGMPGERISVRNHQVYINGVAIQRPKDLSFLKYYDYGNLLDNREVDCGKGYYVMGDDSIDSQDSRYIGPVMGEKFRGRVWCVLWPSSQVRFVR